MESAEAARNAKEALELAFQMSNILETGLDRHTLSLLVALCDRGVNPEALAAVVRELFPRPRPPAAPTTAATSPSPSHSHQVDEFSKPPVSAGIETCRHVLRPIENEDFNLKAVDVNVSGI